MMGDAADYLFDSLFNRDDDLDFEERRAGPKCRRCGKQCTWMQQTGKWVLGDHVGSRLRLHVCVKPSDDFEDLDR